MAGRPKTQAKRLAQALRSHGIDPDALLTAAPAPTPGVEPLNGGPPHARAHARGTPGVVQPLGRVSSLGPETRRAIDQRTVDDLAQLALQLQPGLTLRLERTRPYYAAGHVEDITIDDTDLGAQLDYIRSEHGGQVYRGTVLGMDGTPIFVARIPIAGPPRKLGRVMPRGYWDGTEEPSAPQHSAPTVPAPALGAGPTGMADMLQLFDRMHAMTERSEQATLGAVREMITTHQTQQTQLLEALVERSQGGKLGFKQQLAELAEATQAIEDIREVLGVPPSGQGGGDQLPSRSVLQGAFEQMAAGVMAQGLRNDQERAARKRAQQQQQPGAARPAHFRRVPRRPKPPAQS